MVARVAIATLLAVATTAIAADVTIPSTTTLPMKVVDHRPFIEVRVNGQGPFHFLLDSGSSSIVSASLAKRLGLKTYGAFAGRGVGEKPIAAAYCDVSDIQIGDLHFPNQKIATADLGDIVNAIGFESLDGIVGYELFAARVVTIDFEALKVTLTPPGFYFTSSKALVQPIKIVDRLPVIEGSIDGLPGTFSLDTGDRWWLTLHTPFVATHHLMEKYHPTIQALTGWGGGGPVVAYVTRTQTLSIGKVDLGAPLTRLPLARAGAFTRPDISGNIGAGILRHLKVTFDYPAKLVVLENIPARANFTDSYDRSGMWLSKAGDSFEVAWIVEDGPATQAGIRKGDPIVAVDGRSAHELFLPDLREQLCDPQRKEVLVVVKSGDRTQPHTIRLRDLVR